MKLALAAILAAAAPALAQPFTLEWSTIDSGGAIAVTAGGFSLSGTVGQPDAGILAAAPYECQAGFWHTEGASCYANCDGSLVAPVLNANDFQCFLNKYAAADPYANCDGSQVAPILNANDFQCFLNKFAAGCS